ncbi:DUF898 domain-containing protein [Maritimibacter sp. 55A14]|nr:DUF898 domain-containing protein [Maritimibacter sp. 55A14]
MEIEFAGTRGPLMRLALATSVKTVLTLGIYRFWAKTRLRRWYWSAVRPGGVPLEYAGEPLEKLMGFLIAVVFLAFYIGVVNLVLVFFSFSLLADNGTAYALSFVGLVPFWFYARYRARRYLLARTRWRGLRFGQEPGAWAYAWRALGHWAVTLLSLGLLLPRQTFWLEKFRTDRTWYGAARLEQGGRWQMLWPAMRHLLMGGALTALGLAATLVAKMAWLIVVPGAVWALAGLVYYRVHSFRILAAHKRLAGGIGFNAQPRAGRVLRIYILGNLLIAILLGVLITAVTVLAALAFAALGGLAGPEFWAALGGGGILTGVTTAAGVVFYFVIFILWGVLGHAFVTMPVLAHYAETLEIENPHRLAEVTQRPRDAFAEAEGFAEALDVGAAI